MAVPVWQLLLAGDDGHDAENRAGLSHRPFAHPSAYATGQPSSRDRDAALVARVRAGDATAFEEVYRAHVRALVLYVARIVGSRDTAVDVVQGLFLKLWQSRARWRVDGAIDVYLFAAARNAARNTVRSEVTRARRTGEAVREAPVSQTDSTEEATLRDAAALSQAIARSIEALPAKCREVFLLSRAEGLSYPEIARRLGISVKTVEMHISRALKGLRETLAPFRE